MNISCFGLSHQTAGVEIRERFAIPDSGLPEALLRLKAVQGLEEGLIVSTCNRTEFYVAGAVAQLPVPQFFHEFYRGLKSGDEPHLFQLPAAGCVRHLFRVVSGLESMAVGETEIFGQVKRAYEAAVREQVTGRRLNKLFQRSFHVGKQVRSSTAIGRGNISVASVAVELAEQIFGELEGCKIMLLGAGDTSEKMARSFKSRGARQIFVSNRSFDRAKALAEETGGRAVRFDEWGREFTDLDILVSSTAAPHAIVTVEKIAPILRRRGDRPLFMIDVAFPRDIEPEVHRLEGVYVYDLDALQLMAERSMQARQQEAADCDRLIAKHVADFQAWMEKSVDSMIGHVGLNLPPR
ncbi:MAG: glutamyl-tRNA reductase [Verrucomicrobia bacterium]|nr:glutamyl-tRNA reductase [Verrucomicrobiota bacterium]